MDTFKIYINSTLAAFSLKSIFSKIGSIGSHPDDSEEVRLQKTLLIAYTGSMAVMAFFWGLLYFYFDEPLAGSIPFLYSLISLTGLAIFSQTKSFSTFLKSQLAFSLVLPFLLMISLGGFASSSAVIMWSLTSPLGALVLKGRKEALYWFIAFIGLLFVSMYLEDKTPFSSNLPEHIIIVFFAMNIIGTSLTSFIILRHFVGEKNLALTLLEKKHEWIKDAFSAYVSPNLVDYLLKNPGELKLGGERRECTFVFTDLVGFTPLIEK